MHQRRHEQAEDDGDQDNSQTPVAAEVVKELDTVKYRVLTHLPHFLRYLSFLLYQRGPTILTEQDRIRMGLPDDILRAALP